MREYTVEHSSLNFKWTFQRMLPSLPGPGTPAFAELCKGLHPYGITPSKVVIETPSSRLGDVFVSIGLLDNRLGVRFTSAALELYLDELLVDDEEKLIPIADMLFTAVSSIDADAINGTANLKITSHLKLLPDEHEALVRAHQALQQPEFNLDAVVYKINFGSESRARDFRLALAKSIAYENAIFVELSADYDGPATPTELAAHINTDAERAFELLGLQEQREQPSDADKRAGIK